MKRKELPRSMGKSTRAIHMGKLKDSLFGEVSVPIFQSSTFAFPNAEEGAARFSGKRPGFIYTRLNNPTVNALEANVVSLEAGFGGMATATGMAAIGTVFMTYLHQHAHVVSTASVYGATRVLLEMELPRFGVRTTFVDSSDPEKIRQALGPETRYGFRRNAPPTPP